MDERNFLNKYIEKKEGQRLRGERISQIRKDLNNKDLSDKEKMLKYGDHLNWLLKTIERIYKLQQTARLRYMDSMYDHGLANGLILSMAVLVEEQSTPPYLKADGQYKKSEVQFTSEKTEEYMLRLEALLANMVLADDDGPKGYESFADWAGQVFRTLQGAPVVTGRLRELRNEFYKQAKQNLEIETATQTTDKNNEKPTSP